MNSNTISYRTHYDNTFANSNYAYEQVAPAYAYGYELARRPQFQERDWSEIEADARQDWESKYAEQPWEAFKTAVRHGWEQVKDAFEKQFSEREEEYERHLEMTHGEAYTYAEVLPAYRFGYQLGMAPGSIGLDWTAVEADARTRWEAKREGTWDEFKDSVRYGWNSVRESVV